MSKDLAARITSNLLKGTAFSQTPLCHEVRRCQPCLAGSRHADDWYHNCHCFTFPANSLGAVCKIHIACTLRTN